MMAFFNWKKKSKTLVVTMLILALISTYAAPASVFAEDQSTGTAVTEESSLDLSQSSADNNPSDNGNNNLSDNDNSNPSDDGVVIPGEQAHEGDGTDLEDPDRSGSQEGSTDPSGENPGVGEEAGVPKDENQGTGGDEGIPKVESPETGDGEEQAPDGGTLPSEGESSPGGIDVNMPTEGALELASEAAITSEPAIVLPEETALTVIYHFKTLAKEVPVEDERLTEPMDSEEWTETETFEHLLVGDEVAAEEYGIADQSYRLVSSDPKNLKLEADGNVINLYYEELEDDLYVPVGMDGVFALFRDLPQTAMTLRFVSFGVASAPSLQPGEVAVEKSAAWADYDNRIAAVTFKVKGEPRREPVNIVLVLDKSGSMTWNTNSTNTEYSPCTNPAHTGNPYGDRNTKEKNGGPHRNAAGVAIDRSTNNGCTDRLMNEKDAAVSFINQFLANNTLDNRMALVTFDSDVSSTYSRNFTDSADNLLSKISGINANGGTNYGGALWQAKDYIDGLSSDLKARKTYVVMLSDGKPNSGYEGTVAAQSLKSSGVTVYSVGIQLGTDSDSALKAVASSNSHYYNVKQASDLTSVLNAIAGELKDAGTSAKIEDYINTTYYEYYRGSAYTQPSDIVWGGNATPSEPAKVTWNISGGKITAAEKTVTFYIELKDSYKNQANTYLTNTGATLSYTDVYGSPATRNIPSPQLSVESGNIKINYRLVDKTTGLYITDQGSTTDNMAFSQIVKSEDYVHNGSTILPISAGGSNYTVATSEGTIITDNITGKTYVVFEDDSKTVGLTRANPNGVVNFKCYEQEKFTVTFSSESDGILTGSGITVNAEGKVVYTDVAPGTTFTLLLMPATQPSQHFEFDYWKDDVTGAKVTSFPTTVIQNLNYTAVYKSKTYSVSYDSQGGSPVADSPSGVPVGTYNVTSVVPFWEGHSFDKWTENPNGAGQAYVSGAQIFVDRNITLYAQWKLNNHKVTYQPGSNGTLSVNPATGGTKQGNGDVVHSSVNYGAVIPGEPTVSPNSGWEFTEFTPTKPGDNRMPDTDLIYIAQYKQIDYIITFHKGGHGNLVGQDSSGTVTYNNKHYDESFPDSPEVNAADGYAFTGWKLNDEGSLITKLPEKVTGNASYTAQYKLKDDLSYTVKYYKNSVADSNSLGEAQVGPVTFDDRITLEAGTASGKLNYKKPAGYKDGVQTAPVPYVIQDGANIINVVYEKDTFEYTVKYYVDEIGLTPYNPSNPVKGNYLGSVTGSGIFEADIPADLAPTASEIKAPTGYATPGVRSGVATISADSSANIVHVVYSKKTDLSYTINYFKDTVTGTLDSPDFVGTTTVENITYGAVIVLSDTQLNAHKPSSGYQNGVQQGDNPDDWTIETSGHVINVLYTKKSDLAYTVEYYADDLNGNAITTAAITGVTFDEKISLGAGTAPGQLDYGRPTGYLGGVQQGETPYTIIDGNNVIKVLYTKDSYLLTVQYKYGSASGAEAAPTTTASIVYKGDYSVASPVIDGYTTTLPVVSGTMPAENVTVTVVYTANNHEVTVIHVYEGEPAVTSTSSGIFGTTVSASAIDRGGFTFDGNPVVTGMTPDATGRVVSGTMPDGNVTITFNYTRNTYPVTVIYNEVTDNGTFVKEISSSSAIQAYGSDYDVTAVNPNTAEYTFKNTEGVSTGKVTGDVTVTHNYTRNTYPVTVIYNEVTSDGTLVKEISSSSAIKAYGADYNLPETNPNAAEYTFYSTVGTPTGTVTGDVTVTHNYTRNDYTVTVIYNEVTANGTLVKEISSSSAIKAYGADYDVTKVNPNEAAYTFHSTVGTPTGTVGGDVTVTHNYTRNDYTVTVIYNEVTDDGTFVKEISSSSAIKAYGAGYDVTATNPNAAEYIFHSTVGTPTGTVGGDVTVTHNYTRNVVTITFYPGTNGTLGAPAAGGITSGTAVVYSLKYGDKFPTPPTATASRGYHFTEWTPSITSEILNGIVTANASYTAQYDSNGGGGGDDDNRGGGGGGGNPGGDSTPPVTIEEEAVPASPVEIVDEEIPGAQIPGGNLPKTGGIDALILYGLGALLAGGGLVIRRREKKNQ